MEHQRTINLTVENNLLYDDTLLLLKKYRDVVWSLELSLEKVRNSFPIEHGDSIDDFLDAVNMAGINFRQNDLFEYAQSIERSHKMLQLIRSSVDLLRAKHKNGELYYWILYYSFLSPQAFRNADEIMEQLRLQICEMSYQTFYRKRKAAINALSSMLWVYSSRDDLFVLNQLIYKEKTEQK